MVNFSVYTAYNKHNTALKVFYTLFTHLRLLYENLTRQTALTCYSQTRSSVPVANKLMNSLMEK